MLYNFGIIYPSNSLRSELLRVFIFNPPPFCLVPGLSISGRFTINSPGTGRVHPPLAVALDQRPRSGKLPADWQELVPMEQAAYSGAQLDLLREGDLAGCFGG